MILPKSSLSQRYNSGEVRTTAGFNFTAACQCAKRFGSFIMKSPAGSIARRQGPESDHRSGATIGKAALLTVRDGSTHTPHFAPYKPFPGLAAINGDQ
jgi:hypothetical protein